MRCLAIVIVSYCMMTAWADAKTGKYLSHQEVHFHVKVRTVLTPMKFMLDDGTTIILEGVSLEGVSDEIYEKALRLARKLLEGKRVDFRGTSETDSGAFVGWIECSGGIGFHRFHPLFVAESFRVKWTDWVHLNEELIIQGYARVDQSSVEKDRLSYLEEDAKRLKRGVWAVHQQSRD